MPLLDTLRPKISSQTNGIYRFDYPEVFVLILTVVLLALHFDFSATSMALLIVVSLPSLLILIYNYRRQTSFWTSNIVIILLSAVIGSIQLCTVMSISLAALIALRIIISSPENQIRLVIVSIVTVIVFYYVSVILNSTQMDCHDSWLTPVVLLSSMAVMLCQFRYVYQKYMGHQQRAQQAVGRLSTMVSVINKLTRFVPPQIWEPIVKTDAPVSVSNKRAKLTIMFSDIVGFTELSDSLSSDNLADILNTYMHCMTVIANKHGAVLDKFVGDGMVCFLESLAVKVRVKMRLTVWQWR